MVFKWNEDLEEALNFYAKVEGACVIAELQHFANDRTLAWAMEKCVPAMRIAMQRLLEHVEDDPVCYLADNVNTTTREVIAHVAKSAE